MCGEKMNYYKMLGITKNATQAQIKAAYLKLAKKHHPDKVGGDTEAFQKIKQAFDVLYNAETRAEYDETGGVSEKKDDRAELIEILSMLFLGVLDKAGTFELPNPIEEMEAHLAYKKTTYNNSIAVAQTLISKRNNMLRRIARKGDGENLLKGILLGDINKLERSIVNGLKGIEQCDKLIELLNDYEFVTDIPMMDNLIEMEAA
jgi:curved DNA-binding protein CbpA